MSGEALFATLLDLLSGLGLALLLFVLIVGVLALEARREKRLPEREPELEPEVEDIWAGPWSDGPAPREASVSYGRRAA